MDFIFYLIIILIIIFTSDRFFKRKRYKLNKIKPLFLNKGTGRIILLDNIIKISKRRK